MKMLRRAPVEVDEENPYWVSFSDIMAALVVIFILASLVLLMQLVEIKTLASEEFRRLQEAQKVRQSIVEEVIRNLDAQGISIQVSEDLSVIRIPDKVLGFESGAYDISSKHRETGLAIGRVLLDAIKKDNRIEFLDTVFIEGHTDSRPHYGRPGKGNWGLSTFRAISLWELWRTELAEGGWLQQVKNVDGKALFSVSGYGPSRPAVPAATTEEMHSQNRRVDVRITIRRPITEVNTVLGEL
ncbi:OmpA family protein [Alcanivorax sp. 1008]|uniref:OmpA/MotB family protein n=1 Tax=Alcanivorax sp. 1008 TaxID=2816853 RepID=UPI001D46F87E|nr:OmpA family protein [Alcanivorax sp. 1008]MCC1498125.1 OmpA family protein [Alcanivorax sp. 1008]